MEYEEQIRAWRAGGVEEERAVCAALGAEARDLDKDQTFLAELGLGSAEAAALTRQGFVSCAARGRGRIVYKPKRSRSSRPRGPTARQNRTLDRAAGAGR